MLRPPESADWILAMISIALVTLLSVTATQAPSSVPPRTSFSKCLKAEIKKNLSEKVLPEEFDKRLVSACKSEEAIYTQFVVSNEMKLGSKRAEAAKSAAGQVADYQEVAKADYRGYLEAGDSPD